MRPEPPQKPNATQPSPDILSAIDKLLQDYKPVLNSIEACEFLSITQQTLYWLTHKKQIQFYKPNKKLIYFKREDLINYMLQNPIAPIEKG